MKRMAVVAVLLLLSISPLASVYSQTPPSCPQIVTLALESTEELCESMGSSTACYGHVHIDASPRPGVDDFDFTTQGDIAALQDIQVFQLSSMDPEAGTWGVALLNVKTYMQYAEPEDVTFLLFGDVAIEDTSASFTSIEMTVAGNSYLNARLGPDPAAGVLGVLAPAQTVEARARNADSTWVLVELPENGRLAWVYAPLLNSEEAVDTLAIANENGSYYGPMQAFQVQTGANDAPCPESPDSGLLVQTPEGVAEITLLVNEVIIDMQATLFLQAQPGDDFRIMVVDGWAEVEVDGHRQPVFAGSQVVVPLSEDGAAAGVPSPPEPYLASSMQSLPVGSLTTPVEVSAPLSEDELATVISEWVATQIALFGPSAASSDSSTQDDASDLNAGTSDGTSDTQSGDTGSEPAPSDPGHTPPGHGGTPPGQEKKNN